MADQNEEDLNRRIAEIKRKNELAMKRRDEVLADQRLAEESGSSITNHYKTHGPKPEIPECVEEDQASSHVVSNIPERAWDKGKKNPNNLDDYGKEDPYEHEGWNSFKSYNRGRRRGRGNIRRPNYQDWNKQHSNSSRPFHKDDYADQEWKTKSEGNSRMQSWMPRNRGGYSRGRGKYENERPYNTDLKQSFSKQTGSRGRFSQRRNFRGQFYSDWGSVPQRDTNVWQNSNALQGQSNALSDLSDSEDRRVPDLKMEKFLSDVQKYGTQGIPINESSYEQPKKQFTTENASGWELSDDDDDEKLELSASSLKDYDEFESQQNTMENIECSNSFNDHAETEINIQDKNILSLKTDEELEYNVCQSVAGAMSERDSCISEKFHENSLPQEKEAELVRAKCLLKDEKAILTKEENIASCESDCALSEAIKMFEDPRKSAFVCEYHYDDISHEKEFGNSSIDSSSCRAEKKPIACANKITSSSSDSGKEQIRKSAFARKDDYYDDLKLIHGEKFISSSIHASSGKADTCEKSGNNIQNPDSISPINIGRRGSFPSNESDCAGKSIDPKNHQNSSATIRKSQSGWDVPEACGELKISPAPLSGWDDMSVVICTNRSKSSSSVSGENQARKSAFARKDDYYDDLVYHLDKKKWS